MMRGMKTKTRGIKDGAPCTGAPSQRVSQCIQGWQVGEETKMIKRRGEEHLSHFPISFLSHQVILSLFSIYPLTPKNKRISHILDQNHGKERTQDELFGCSSLTFLDFIKTHRNQNLPTVTQTSFHP